VSYISCVNKHSPPSPRTVPDPKTGKLLTVRGFGALKGSLTVRKGIDLTKPIATQVEKLDRRKP
jgi:hypothetical protein